MTGWVVATDSLRRDEVLFMVDRRRQRKSFWSNRTDDAFVYLDIGAAQAKASSMRFNNPRVLPLAVARQHSNYIKQREKERFDWRMEQEALDAMEEGWDGHKCWTS